MLPAVKMKKELSVRVLNVRQDLFCKIYATDPYCMGNGADCYKKAYGEHISTEVAKAAASRFLMDFRFTERINEYIEVDGFNNETIDKHHLFLIKQKKDLGVSMKGVQEYNKLKKRVSNALELIIPKPIMDLDDDEVIHKINKGKAIDIRNTKTPEQVE